jgi:anti-anti-sigma regulatory factor
VLQADFDLVAQLVSTDPLPVGVIFRGGAATRLDITSAEMLVRLVTTLHSADIEVALADVRQPLVEMARRAGLLDTLRIFRTLDEAVAALADLAGTSRG